jgi:hypothetical protein
MCLMKTIIFCALFTGCVGNLPVYESPTLIAPADGAAFSEIVAFEWVPNNAADSTTRDYAFLLQVASDAEFKTIKASFSTKLATKYEAPLHLLRSGVLYWRVEATYVQMTGGKFTRYSETRTFTYDGNDGAVYVDKAAMSTGFLGTKTQPVKTINAAFSIARRRFLSSVIVAGASYVETVPQWAGYSVKGCYDAVTWTRNVAACATTFSDAAAVTYYAPFD